MKIIFQYLDKNQKKKSMLYFFFKKKRNNIYKLQQLDFSAQICLRDIFSGNLGTWQNNLLYL